MKSSKPRKSSSEGLIINYNSLKKSYFELCSLYSIKHFKATVTFQENVQRHSRHILEFYNKLEKLQNEINRLYDLKNNGKERIKLDPDAKRKGAYHRVKYEKGMRFANFIILEEGPNYLGKTGLKYSTWDCLCDCGNEFRTTTKQINRGSRKSCGCKSISNHYVRTKDPQDVITKVKFGQYKLKAKRRKIDWDLSYVSFLNLIKSSCHYCGSPPSHINYYKKKKRILGQVMLNGIDRIDSSRGYTLENTYPCCKTCNYAKSNLSYAVFLEWLDKLIKNRSNL